VASFLGLRYFRPLSAPLTLQRVEPLHHVLWSLAAALNALSALELLGPPPPLSAKQPAKLAWGRATKASPKWGP
jgi:hypothetical protein